MAKEPTDLVPQTRALARRSLTVELAIPIDEALTRFRAEVGVPILSAEHARLPPSGVAYAELTEGGFVLRHPGPPRRGAGRGFEDIGPSVEGRLVPSADGARLELRSSLMSLTPSQKSVLSVVAAIVVGCGIGMISAGAPGWLFVTLAILGFALGRGYRDRRRRELDLLARVQRVFGPVTRAAIEAPYRE